jgi:hypothetical protein
MQLVLRAANSGAAFAIQLLTAKTPDPSALRSDEAGYHRGFRFKMYFNGDPKLSAQFIVFLSLSSVPQGGNYRRPTLPFLPRPGVLPPKIATKLPVLRPFPGLGRRGMSFAHPPRNIMNQ